MLKGGSRDREPIACQKIDWGELGEVSGGRTGLAAEEALVQLIVK